MRLLPLLIAMCVVTACVKSESKPNQANGEPTNTANKPEPESKETPLETLRKDIKEVASRPEQKADQIEVQHLLVAYKDAGIPGVSRTKEEAEKLTAEIWKQIKDGGDFAELIKKHTNDSPPGIYGMTMVGPGDRNKMIFPRTGMVAAFGDVGWRLKVGEFGVAPFDPKTSPYGWHIIKRTK